MLALMTSCTQIGEQPDCDGYVEGLCERFYVLGVVTPLEFLQHRLSEMGHRNLLVTHTLPGWPSEAHA
jgi:hypothetical protein